MINFRKEKYFTKEQLEDLFLSLNWESGRHPERLQLAMENAHTVFGAWDGEKLVGLMNALSDGHMTAYFHYLLVRPEYQGKGIGQQLVSLMLEVFKDLPFKTLIAYEDKVGFYNFCGFETGNGKIPMSVSSL